MAFEMYSVFSFFCNQTIRISINYSSFNGAEPEAQWAYWIVNQLLGSIISKSKTYMSGTQKCNICIHIGFEKRFHHFQ